MAKRDYYEVLTVERTATEEDIKNALKAVKYPGYSRDIVSFGLVKQIASKDGAVTIVGSRRLRRRLNSTRSTNSSTSTSLRTALRSTCWP